MGHTIPREKDVEFDLESGGNTSEEDSSNDLYASERESKSAFRWSSWNGILNFDGSDNDKSVIESCSNSTKSDDVMIVDENNSELLMDKGLEHVQQQLDPLLNGNCAKQKTKPTNPRRSSKPPLPPKGPLLDAGDQKFVKELAELALRKRARVKKMKAVRKMKENKSCSSSSSTYTNLSAMLITVFFFLVILLHGIRSASSASVGLTASPEAAVAADGFISVHYPTNFKINESDTPSSHYPIQQER